MKYAVLNVNCGNGPYCRSIDIVLSLNKRLLEVGQDPLGIVIPHLYGERQIRILQEEFSQAVDAHPEWFALDEKYGDLLAEILYSGKDYGAYLQGLVTKQPAVQKRIDEHFSSAIHVTSLDGKRSIVEPYALALTLSRNPIVSLPIFPSYYTSIHFFSDLINEGVKDQLVDAEIAQSLLPILKRVEADHSAYFITEPATFSYRQPSMRGPDERAMRVPPLVHPLEAVAGEGALKTGVSEPCAYITISGLPQSQIRAGKEVVGDLKVYVSKEGAIAGADRRPPSFIAQPEVVLHFARSGWSSVWNSMFSETLFVTPRYQRDDDVEIFYNEKTLLALGLGEVVDVGAPALQQKELQAQYVGNVRRVKQRLREKYGSLDGVEFVAGEIAQRYLSNS
jgi:hypothetical protein